MRANERIAAASGHRIPISNPAAGGSGKYLFVPHPNCCPNCNKLGLSPHFYNTPDVAFISHPNCKCATIEAPAGLSPVELMEWAKHPVGPMRFGFNYGIALRTLNVTERNRESVYKHFFERMSPVEEGKKSRRLIRAKVTQAQIDRVREAVENGELGKAKNLTGSIKSAATRLLNKKKSERIPVKTAQVKKRTTPIQTYKNNGTTTWIPQPIKRTSTGKKKDTTVIRRNFQGNTAVVPRNKKRVSFGKGSASSLARSKMEEERRRRKERERILRERGFI